jgi:RNA recognition motif-containing protein
MRKSNRKGNVFVGNLPPDFSDERLAEAFDPFGIVLCAAVARDPSTGARLRYGFVDIATDRAATTAISALDGTEIDGCKLNVKPSENKPKAMSGGDPAARRQPPRHIPAPEHGEVNGAPPGRTRLSQSAIARAQIESIEPPPRRDFEIVTGPVRRKTPSFRLERRTLPRRV